MCIPEQSALTQGSNADVQSSQRKRKSSSPVQGTGTGPNRYKKGSQKYIGRVQAASDQRGKNYDLKKVTYQRRDPAPTKSLGRPTKPARKKEPTNRPVYNPPETIKSSHVELAPNDKSKFSSSPVEVTPSSSFATNNFSPSSFVSSNNLPPSPTFHPPATESGGEPSGATLDVTEHKSGNEVVQTKRGTSLGANENDGKDETADTGSITPSGATGYKIRDQGKDTKGGKRHKLKNDKSKEKEDFGEKLKPKLTEEDILRIRERFSRFQNRSASVTKSTFEQEVESASPSKATNSYHQDSQASVTAEKQSKRPKRKLLSGFPSTLVSPHSGSSSTLELPQEEYEYIDYPAPPPPPPQSKSPCPEPWQSQCQQRNDTCWVPVTFQ